MLHKILRAVSLYGERRDKGETVDIPQEMGANIGIEYLEPIEATIDPEPQEQVEEAQPQAPDVAPEPPQEAQAPEEALAAPEPEIVA